MHSTDPEHITRSLKDKTERHSVSCSRNVAVETIMEFTAERDYCLLRLNDYKVSKEIWNEEYQKNIVKAITASSNQLEKKVNSLKDGNRLIRKTNKEFMRKYREQNTVVGRNLAKVVKRVAIRSTGMEMCIGKDI